MHHNGSQFSWCLVSKLFSNCWAKIGCVGAVGAETKFTLEIDEQVVTSDCSSLTGKHSCWFWGFKISSSVFSCNSLMIFRTKLSFMSQTHPQGCVRVERVSDINLSNSPHLLHPHTHTPTHPHTHTPAATNATFINFVRFSINFFWLRALWELFQQQFCSFRQLKMSVSSP
jgi:hypothetical protein